MQKKLQIDQRSKFKQVPEAYRVEFICSLDVWKDFLVMMKNPDLKEKDCYHWEVKLKHFCMAKYTISKGKRQMAENIYNLVCVR